MMTGADRSENGRTRMTKDRIAELREWVNEAYVSIHLRVPSDRGKRDDLLALLDEAEKPSPGPSNSERAATWGDIETFLIKFFCPYWSAASPGDRKAVSAIAQHFALLPAPAPQPSVSIERVKHWFPCRCEPAWKDRGLTMPGCDFHDTCWSDLLDELGVRVDEAGKGEKE
jgi:hypothetical protein